MPSSDFVYFPLKNNVLANKMVKCKRARIRIYMLKERIYLYVCFHGCGALCNLCGYMSSTPLANDFFSIGPSKKYQPALHQVDLRVHFKPNRHCNIYRKSLVSPKKNHYTNKEHFAAHCLTTIKVCTHYTFYLKCNTTYHATTAQHF